MVDGRIVDPKILDRAARLQQHSGIDVQSAEAAGIDRQFIDQAIAEISLEKKWHRLIVLSSLTILLLCLSFVAIGFNTLSHESAQVKMQWAQVEEAYRRRFDLLPKLADNIRASTRDRQALIQQIATLKQTGDRDIVSQMGDRLWVEVVATLRNDPDLWQTMQVQIEGSDNRISVERRKYNEKVTRYSLARSSFPLSIVAHSFAFDEPALLTVDREKMDNPRLQY